MATSMSVRTPEPTLADARPSQKIPPPRNRILDFVRIGLALLVLLSHAPELVDGNRSRELLTRYGRTDISFGEVGVDFFFVLSGYLITRSWVFDPRLGDYLKKRLLRILPGYVVAFVGSIVVCGLVAPSLPRVAWFEGLFHRPLVMHAAISFFILSVPWTPDAFPGQAFHAVNSSLWTLGFEFRCYLLVALFGVLRLFRIRTAWLIATLASGLAFPWRGGIDAHAWHHYTWITGSVGEDIRLFFAFLLGGSFFLYKKYIPFRPTMVAAAALLLLVSLLTHTQFQLVLLVTGAYLMFALEKVQLPNTGWYAKVPDISYGMYVYGWPVQQLCIWFLHPNPWLLFMLSSVISMFMGALSWHFVERPMLALKPRPSAPLPPDSLESSTTTRGLLRS
jgi:peptidoglycan/LPS O-acetylase OafA/YrhL